MLDLLDDLQSACAALIFLVHAQRIDYEYSAKDLADFSISLAFLEALFRPFVESEADLNYVIGRLSQLDEATKQQAHLLIQTLHDEIHSALAKGAGREAEISFEIQEVIETIVGQMISKLTPMDKSIKIRKERRPAADKDDDYQIVG